MGARPGRLRGSRCPSSSGPRRASGRAPCAPGAFPSSRRSVRNRAETPHLVLIVKIGPRREGDVHIGIVRELDGQRSGSRMQVDCNTTDDDDVLAVVFGEFVYGSW